MYPPFLRAATAASLAAAVLAACGGGNSNDNAAAPVQAPASVGDTVVLTASGKLVSFNRTAPATVVGSAAPVGLPVGETLLGIDYRPADGLLYALSSAGKLYTIDASTGSVTVKSTLSADPADATAPFTQLSGESFGVDFNPVADRLRVVSNTGQDLRINVDTGATTTDGTVARAGASASVSAAGYTNSFAGTTSTLLYVIDAAAGQLYLQDPPNNGTLGAPLALGVAGAAAANGFDIDARTNIGYAALTAGAGSTLYTIDLATGAAKSVGVIAGGEAVRGLALRQAAAPQALGLTADNRLVAFNPAAPSTLTANLAISGLAAGEQMVGIDMRPNGATLVGISSNARLFTIDAATGVATFKATLMADAADTTLPYAGLVGTVVATDFNPVADRLRVITSGGQNLRINVDTGATTTDGAINRAGAAPRIAAAAYGNSFAGTTTTTLYDFDADGVTLSLQSPPNDGALVPVGVTSQPFTVGSIAFDIAGGNNGLPLAALRAGASGPSALYSVTLATGALAPYRGLAGNAALVGGAAGPELIDLAIRY